jgi:hypothetical protein
VGAVVVAAVDVPGAAGTVIVIGSTTTNMLGGTVVIFKGTVVLSILRVTVI